MGTKTLDRKRLNWPGMGSQLGLCPVLLEREEREQKGKCVGWRRLVHWRKARFIYPTHEKEITREGPVRGVLPSPETDAPGFAEQGMEAVGEGLSSLRMDRLSRYSEGPKK